MDQSQKKNVILAGAAALLLAVAALAMFRESIFSSAPQLNAEENQAAAEVNANDPSKDPTFTTPPPAEPPVRGAGKFPR